MRHLSSIYEFGLGWIIIIPIDLLTRPEKMEKLKEFYMKCCPTGFWAPITKEIDSRPMPVLAFGV